MIRFIGSAKEREYWIGWNRVDNKYFVSSSQLTQSDDKEWAWDDESLPVDMTEKEMQQALSVLTFVLGYTLWVECDENYPGARQVKGGGRTFWK